MWSGDVRTGITLRRISLRADNCLSDKPPSRRVVFHTISSYLTLENFFNLSLGHVHYVLSDFLPGMLIEVYCKDEIVQEVVSAIETTAHTGLRGDGKVYVIPVEHAVRISTDERGEKAV